MNPQDTPTPPISARSQPLIALAVGGCLVAAAGWFAAAGGLTGKLVHHDEPPAAENRFTVDVNAADETELAQLPGLGTATARRIIDHRREHGPFTALDGLLDVPGIGPATFDHMRPHLRPIQRPSLNPNPAP